MPARTPVGAPRWVVSPVAFRVLDSHLLGVVTDDMDLQRVSATVPLPQSLRRPTRGMRRPAGGAAAREGRVALGA